MHTTQVSKVHDKMLINHDKSFLLCKRITDADVKNQNIYVCILIFLFGDRKPKGCPKTKVSSDFDA